tara:strand:- start:631 stop:1014 length:384 start_codon:yes stop_codon:yes gene_type:complete
MLAIGQLDRKILIQGSTVAQDAMGGGTRNWLEDLYHCNAMIEFKSVKETDKHDQINEVESVFFYIRNVGAEAKIINSYNYRIIYPSSGASATDDSKYYYITGVQEYEGRDRFIKFTTSLRDDDLGED